jgi:hypothetical protein
MLCLLCSVIGATHQLTAVLLFYHDLSCDNRRFRTQSDNDMLMLSMRGLYRFRCVFTLDKGMVAARPGKHSAPAFLRRFSSPSGLA